MWEMLTWQQPYEGMMTVQVMFSTVNANMRPEVPAESQLPGGPGVSLPRYRELMEGCWDPDASKRPTFKQVLDVLQVRCRISHYTTLYGAVEGFRFCVRISVLDHAYGAKEAVEGPAALAAACDSCPLLVRWFQHRTCNALRRRTPGSSGT